MNETPFAGMGRGHRDCWCASPSPARSRLRSLSVLAGPGLGRRRRAGSALTLDWAADGSVDKTYPLACYPAGDRAPRNGRTHLLERRGRHQARAPARDRGQERRRRRRRPDAGGQRRARATAAAFRRRCSSSAASRSCSSRSARVGIAPQALERRRHRRASPATGRPAATLSSNGKALLCRFFFA